MIKYLLIFFQFLVFHTVFAQGVEIPEELEFAGLTLKLTHGARKTIGTDVAAITKNQKFFQQKVERANLYFPLIERIFKEENFPDDFKYLALQESSLISDVVSSSNAVGYWQFKKESAQEVGLRVDRNIDERMNIVSSTRGAAKYLKKNNVYLNNWVYTLLSYNLGRGGVASFVKEKYRGVSEMPIDQNTHWYVLRFLAHKIAYEKFAGKNPHSEYVLHMRTDMTNKSLQEVATEFNVHIDDLRSYNKWLMQHKVPDDKGYPLILPLKLNQADQIASLIDSYESTAKNENIQDNKAIKEDIKYKQKRRNKRNENNSVVNLPPVFEINKLRAVKAREGDNVAVLALAGKLDVQTFLKRNDLTSEQITAGQVYYVEAKRGKALVPFHTLLSTENLWNVSQQYGIRINNLKRKNRIKKNELVKPGRVLWLQRRRPKNIPVEYKDTKSVEVEKSVKGSDQPLIVGTSQISEKKEWKESAVQGQQYPVDTSTLIVDNTIQKEGKADWKRDETEGAVFQSKEKPDSSKIIHTVRQGETLYLLSKKYSVKIDSIKTWNSLPSNDLKIGSAIVVGNTTAKFPQNTTGNKITYIVKQGDTIYQISKKFNVTVYQVQNWNNKKDFNVSIGEQLVLYK